MFKPSNRIEALILFFILIFIQTFQVKFGLRDELDVTFPSVVTTADPEKTVTHDWRYIVEPKTTTKPTEAYEDMSELAVTFGGSGADNIKGSAMRNDGSYLLCGNSSSNNSDILSPAALTKGSDNKTVVSKWVKPYGFLACFKSDGSLLWSNEIGGNGMTVINDCAVLTDGSIVAVGYTMATNLLNTLAPPDVVISAFICRFSQGGALQSCRVLAGEGFDYLNAVAPLSGGGYVAVGESESSTGDFAFKSANPGAVMMAYNSQNEVQWTYAVTGSTGGSFNDVDTDSDGAVYAVLVSNCGDGEFANLPGFGKGLNDSAVMKFTGTGTRLWCRALAGSGNDNFCAVAADGKGGCVAAGYYQTLHDNGVMDGTFEGYFNFGGIDGFAFFINADGAVTGGREFAGVEDDKVTDVTRIGSSFVFVGTTLSANRIFAPIQNLGDYDAFAVVTDLTGTITDMHSMSGTDFDAAATVSGSEAYGMLVAGVTSSTDEYFGQTTPPVRYADTAFAARYPLTEAE